MISCISKAVKARPLLLLQVEATKFTEVGFHGRDVDQIIRDLVDNSLLLTKQKLQKKLKVDLLPWHAINQSVNTSSVLWP